MKQPWEIAEQFAVAIEPHCEELKRQLVGKRVKMRGASTIFTIEEVEIFVDGSVRVSTSFPNRPGKVGCGVGNLEFVESPDSTTGE